MPYVKGWALGAWRRGDGTSAAEESSPPPPPLPSTSSSFPSAAAGASSSSSSSSSALSSTTATSTTTTTMTTTTHTPPGSIYGDVRTSQWPLAYFSMTWTTKATDKMVIELSLSCPHLVRQGAAPSGNTLAHHIKSHRITTHHNTTQQRRLRLDGCNLLSDPGVAALSKNCPLRELSLLACPKLSSRSLSHLLTCMTLTSLEVTLNKKVTEEARDAFMRRRPEVTFPEKHDSSQGYVPRHTTQRMW